MTGKLQSTLVDVTGTVHGFDEQKGISKSGRDVCSFELIYSNGLLSGIITLQYYEKALQSTWGSTIFSFYTTTAKQVSDVHAEAVRLNEDKKGKSSTEAQAGGEAAAPAATAPLAL